ncbi:hypothetical protein SUGI_1150970 [Cryptomeria japonica]|nr:hypothetical protein SUGI_1150970 [Cryptomeria japonica]
MRSKDSLHIYSPMRISALGGPYMGLQTLQPIGSIRIGKTKQRNSRLVVQASLLRYKQPLLWAGCACLLYALVRILGPQNQFLPGIEDEKWMPKWLKNMLSMGSETQVADERRKMVSKWHVTTKGTLKRSYRLPMKSVARRLLKAISSLLSDDDTFRDASCHKGCQIRRENAHGESVCCNNVRALFDELPTPHLVVEITAFPRGPLSESDYMKAEKIERILRTEATI